MADLSMAPEARSILDAVADVEYERADRGRLLDLIGECDAFWGHVELKVDREVLDRAKRLRVICTASTGTDHIDGAEAKRRGVHVLSITRDYDLLNSFTATAECAWMLLLACERRLRSALGSALDGRWDGQLFRGRQLSGLTLGVLGVGRLGKMVAGMGNAFRMRVLGCDRVSFRAPGVQPVDFSALLSESDAISVHIHMEPANRHLFNDSAFNRMKPGAVLVNTSRGDIIDEGALIRALESGRLSAFGADVLHDEWRQNMGESPVIRYARTHENVVVTPHIGGCTWKSIVDARVFAARKLAHWLTRGEELTMRSNSEER
jgi:D-3-phosphoglycerate dehydrogenase